MISSFLSVVLGAALMLSIIASAFIIRYYRGKKELETETFRSKYGTLLEGLNTNCFFGCYWNVLILIRWTLTIEVFVLLRDFYSLQVMSLLVLSLLFQVLTIIGKPMKEMRDNRISLFNEVMVSLYIYLLYTLTDYSSIVDFRDEIGWALLAVIFLSTLVNFAKFFFIIFQGIRLRCIKKKLVKRPIDS